MRNKLLAPRSVLNKQGALEGHKWRLMLIETAHNSREICHDCRSYSTSGILRCGKYFSVCSGGSGSNHRWIKLFWIAYAAGNYVVFYPQVMPLSSRYLLWLAVLSDHKDQQINLRSRCQKKIFARIWYYSWWIYLQISRQYSSPKNSNGLYKPPQLFYVIYRIFLRETSGFFWLELIVSNH